MSIIITSGIFLVIIGIVIWLKDNTYSFLDDKYAYIIIIVIGVSLILHPLIYMLLRSQP